MLARLDEFDWAQLTHAYGQATDVPELIRALASGDETARENAIGALFGNIWHQGTVYEATAPAVPFLREILVEGPAAGRADVAALLQAIASGSSYLDVHGRVVKPGQEEDRLSRLDEELTWVAYAHRAVAQGAPSYWTLLDDASGPLERTMLRALIAALPSQHEAVFAQVEAALPGADAAESAQLLAWLAATARAGATVPTEQSAEFLRDADPHVREAAALVLLHVPTSPHATEAVRLLLPNLVDIWEPDFLADWLAADALPGLSDCVALATRIAADLVDEALIEAVTDPDNEHAALLGSQLADRLDLPTRATDLVERSGLDERQVRILKALAAADRLWVGQQLKFELRTRGLPDSRKALRHWLDGRRSWLRRLFGA